MLRYLKIYKIFISNSLSYNAQYRSEFWFMIFFNTLWILTMFLSIEVVFSTTESIAGWNKSAVYLMTLFWILVDEIGIMLFNGNLPSLPDTVTDGKLDHYITKPINTLFAVSTRIFLIRAFYRALLVLVLLVFVLLTFNFHLSFIGFAVGFLLLVCAVAINYALTLAVNTLCFWFDRVDNVNDTIQTIFQIARYPMDVLPRTIKILTLTIIPIAFSAYIPIAILMHYWPWYGIVYPIAFASITVFLAIRFWNFALRRYSSASS